MYVNWDVDVLFFGPWFLRTPNEHGAFWEWENTSTWEEESLNTIVMEELSKVKKLGYKYYDGWAEYDDSGAGDGNDGGGQQLRKDFARFTSLKEVLLSHSSNDGGRYDNPGYTVLEDFDERRLELSRYIAGTDHEEGVDTYYRLARERALRILPAFREKDITPKERQSGIPTIKIVVVKRIPAES